MEKEKRISDIFKYLLSFVLFIIVTLFPGRTVLADDVVYSTSGGTWEQVNETTWTMDKDGDGTTDVVLEKMGNAWKYTFTVADDKATYYAWEEPVPEGYTVAGRGSRSNPAVSSQTAYSHTQNIGDDGTKNGNYANNLNLNDVVTLPGADSLHVVLTYGGESASYDWVCAWQGSQPTYTAGSNYSSAIAVNGTKKFGGGSNNKVEFDVEGDTVTFGYRSDGSGCGSGYGYYAVVTGGGGVVTITNRSTTTPAPDTGNLTLTKHVTGIDTTATAKKQYFKFQIKLSSESADLTKAVSGDQVFGDVAFKDGEAVVYLSADESTTLEGIPSGVNYTITEEQNTDYTTTWTGTAGTAAENVYTGTIAANATQTVTCNNAYTKPDTPDNPAEKGSLKLAKRFVDITEGKTAVFHLAFWDLEKDKSYSYSDGTTDTTFLSDASGIADVSVTVTEDSQFTFADLPAGAKFQVSEDANNAIASYEITGAASVAQQKGANVDINQTLTTAKETIQADTETVVTFTNTAKETPKSEDELVDIHVEKTWEDNEDALNMRPESITVQLTQDEDVIATAVLDESTHWKTDFTDLDKYAEDGTTECVYGINELDVSGYKSEIKKEARTDGVAGYTFTITNTLVDVGNLKVSKTVKGDGADLTQEFRFTIKLMKDGQPLQGVFKLDAENGTKTGSIAFDEKGQATVNLKHQESISIKDIPAGTSYQVTETQALGYTASNNGVYTGSIKKGTTSEAAVTNTVNPSCKLTVTKTVKGNQGSKTKEFHFQLSLKGSSIPSTLSYTKDGKSGRVSVVNGIAAFTLAHKGTITFNEIPSGVTYTVTETDGASSGYTVASKNSSGKLVKDTTAEFTNTKNVGVPTGAMTNTAALAIVIVGCIAGLILVLTRKRKKKQN